MLSELIPDITMPVDLAITGLTDDSRHVTAGSLFIATPGALMDGRTFIADAIRRSAAAILCEPPVPVADQRPDVPVIGVPDLATRKGIIASRFYGAPSEDMLVLAVTGTNGKTSCSQFIAAALEECGQTCGVIGTLGFGRPGQMVEPGLTTPGAIDLQRRFAALRDGGCQAVSLEASSHGLSQGRLNGTAVDIAVFTNITRDHLDYHVTFEEYKRAKQSLFHLPGLKVAVINQDDVFAEELLSSMPTGVQRITYSATNHDADVYCTSISFNSNGFDADVVTPWGEGELHSGLLGDFNVSNLLAVLGVLGLLENDITEALAAIARLSTVPGRMDRIAYPGLPGVVIDYAHTPDALEKALIALRRHCDGMLWCVVGCGGDRDKGKRPVMGRIAATLADRAVLTDDNPRSESSMQIIKDMLAGIDDRSNVSIEQDRSRAIQFAVKTASMNDIVLIAGKGHEDYQEVKGERLPFSDYREVEKLIG